MMPMISLWPLKWSKLAEADADGLASLKCGALAMQLGNGMLPKSP
jgi:hypothetical protein